MEKHNQNNLTVVRHNHLNRASYSLTLDERRLILSSIALLNPRESMPDEVTVHASDFAHQWGISEKLAYKQLKEARQNLYDRNIRLHDGKGKVTDMRWVYRASYADGAGYISMAFSPDIKPYLTDLKSHFTSYHLLEVRDFKSSHAIRLYELMMQYKETGWMKESVDGLKTLFNVADNYTRWVDFKKYVLEISVKEINTKTNYKIKYDLERKGRKITHVNFTFARNEQGDFFKPPF
jgi:plasmid replication initiation protein